MLTILHNQLDDFIDHLKKYQPFFKNKIILCAYFCKFFKQRKERKIYCGFSLAPALIHTHTKAHHQEKQFSFSRSNISTPLSSN